MKQINKEIAQIIHAPDRCAARERITVKARLLFDYVMPPIARAPRFEDWLAELTGRKSLRPLPGNRLVLMDKDGDVALVQPYAEMFLLNSSRFFNGALGLILLVETCYAPKTDEPDLLNAILASFQPLAGLEGLASPALLHKFLEVDEEFSAWFSGHMRRRRMVAGRDYCMLRPGAGTHIGDRPVEGLGLSPMMAAKVAAATSTVRGRKMKACLIEPGVTSIDLDKNDPALLELLFTHPSTAVFHRTATVRVRVESPPREPMVVRVGKTD